MQRLHPLLLLAVLLLCGGAAAAPPVSRLAQAPDMGDYREAAAAAGFPWGDDTDNEKVCHVLVRVEGNRLTLTIGLPARVPLARAETWLQELVDGLGWSDVRLRSYQDPRQLRVSARARGETRFLNPFRSQVKLDLDLLRSRLRKITPGAAA